MDDKYQKAATEAAGSTHEPWTMPTYDKYPLFGGELTTQNTHTQLFPICSCVLPWARKRAENASPNHTEVVPVCHIPSKLGKFVVREWGRRVHNCLVVLPLKRHLLTAQYLAALAPQVIVVVCGDTPNLICLGLGESLQRLGPEIREIIINAISM